MCNMKKIVTAILHFEQACNKNVSAGAAYGDFHLYNLHDLPIILLHNSGFNQFLLDDNFIKKSGLLLWNAA